MSKKASLTNRSGFTLVEVLIAMAILSSAVILMSQTWGANRVRIKKMAINNRAAFLLDSKMAELENLYAQQVDRIPEEDQGEFENNPGYTWSMTSQEFTMPDLRALLVADGDGDQSFIALIEKLTEFFNESVVEMQVQITYTKGKKSINYKATTFMVDFDKPLPLPGIGGG